MLATLTVRKSTARSCSVRSTGAASRGSATVEGAVLITPPAALENIAPLPAYVSLEAATSAEVTPALTQTSMTTITSDAIKSRVKNDASFSAFAIWSITVYSSWMPILPGYGEGGGGGERGACMRPNQRDVPMSHIRVGRVLGRGRRGRARGRKLSRAGVKVREG